jgi:hypothetical protein
MKKMLSFLSILIITFSICSGCVVRHGDFSVISNKLVRVSDFEIGKADRVKGVEGKETQHIIIFFPTSGPPTLEGALDDALEKGGGDVMTDAVVSTYSFYIPYIYGQAAWVVKGDVVKTRQK